MSSHEPEPGMAVTERVRLVRPLASGGMAHLWVGRHATLGIDVAVKFVRRPDDAVHRQRLVREAQLTVQLDHPHAVRVLDQGVTAGDQPFMVMELLSGESLSARLKREGQLPLEDVRTLVRQMASVLGVAHAAGIVHRDVKPANIVLMDEAPTLHAKLIDFGIARMAGPENTLLTGEGLVLGTPAYMAPDQLIEGRPSGAASDLWALAVVAYEALTGRRPFRGPTRGAIGAAMVLGRLDPVGRANARLPAELDLWFERALNINPELRFADASELALVFDEASRSTGEASSTAPVRIRIPDRLYGRERETAQLMRAYRKAAGGRSRLFVVEGYSGIGKTALVEALRRRLAGDPAVFVGGKFDQFDRGTPYNSIIQAFRELMRRSMADATAAVRQRREKVIEGLGDSGSVLIEVIDELEHLIGPQPAAPEVTPAEARNRFLTAMTRLTSAMASPDQPLVIFLDDLQWADLPSLDLIEALVSDPTSTNVLIVGAYRDNEIGTSDPLFQTLAQLEGSDAEVERLLLGPLGEDAILDLVNDVFPGAVGRMRLATACFRKTRGNAFFVRRFIENLVESGSVRFDDDAELWTWDESSVDVGNLADDVVAFVASELDRQPDRERRAVAVAACVGDHFDLRTLAAALDVDRRDALELLKPALSADLVVPDTSELLGIGDPSAGRLMFRFAHDRIRQAARAAISDADAAIVHRKIGRFMLEHLDASERERRFFELVEHLNRGHGGQARKAERAQLRGLNLDAGRRAIRSAAYQAGHEHFAQARALMPHDAWSSDYPQTLALHVEGARAAYLAGDHDEMDRLVDEAVANAVEQLERVAALEVRCQARLSQQRFTESLELALEILADLGLELPIAPTDGDVAAAVGDTLGRLNALKPGEVEALGMTNDPVVLARQRIQTGAMSAAYLAAPNLLPILGCNIVRSTLDDGVCRDSPYGFAIVGLVLNAARLIDASYATGRMAVDMLDRIGDRAIRPRTMHVVNSHVDLFVDPLLKSVAADKSVTRIGLDTGDLEYACWALHCEVCNSFYAGLPVPQLATMFEANHKTLRYYQQMAALGCTTQYGQAIAGLQGLTERPSRLVGDIYDETTQVPAAIQTNFRGAAYIASALGCFTRYLFGELDDAVAVADAGGPYADGAPATYHEVWWHQYRTLAVLGRVANGAGDDALMADVGPSIELLKTWHAFSAANHEHRIQLVAGEVARVQGREQDARDAYEAAHRAATDNGFAHEAALAVELEARFLRRAGAGSRERIVEARELWRQWGATAKVEQLNEEFGI